MRDPEESDPMGLLNARQELRTIKTLLNRAETEAHSRGDELPGPEHLLVSALYLPDGTAAAALARFGVDADALRAAVEQAHAGALATAGLETPPQVGAPGPAAGSGAWRSLLFRSTPPAQEVFLQAVVLSKAARRFRPSRLLGAHIVAATCTLERGTAARALAALGIDRDELRAAATDAAATIGR